MEIGQHKSQFSRGLIETGARSTRAPSQAVSFAVSIAAHAALIAAIVYFAPAPSKPHSDWVLAYLVEVGDGLSGRSARAGASTMPIRSDAGPLLMPTPPSSRKLPHRSVRVSRTHHEDEMKAPEAEVASLAPASDARGDQSDSHFSNAESSSGAGGDSGTGSGSAIGDGDGSSIAHADYGKNPSPAYPAIARRREQQGTVTLRVLVGSDGVVRRAEIAESSGFDALDDAALETVRRRWRFVPARRGGTSLESWVLVPIRFALTEANAAR